MRTNTKKILGAVAVAGLVATGGSAFTGSGLVDAADETAQVGGTVSQSVVGATLNDVAYTSAADGKVSSVKLTFAAALKTGSSASIKIDAGSALPCTVDSEDTAVYACTVSVPVTVATLAVTVAGADQA